MAFVVWGQTPEAPPGALANQGCWEEVKEGKRDVVDLLGC